MQLEARPLVDFGRLAVVGRLAVEHTSWARHGSQREEQPSQLGVALHLAEASSQ